MGDPRTDEELLAAVDGEPEAFGVFYRRHVRPLLGYFVRRTGDAELAADLCAETFAAALDGLRRFDPAHGLRSRGCTASPVACSGTPPTGASSRTARVAASAWRRSS